MATRRVFLGSDVLTAAPEAWPIPQEVAGVKLPDCKLARDATDFTRGLSAPVVFNHVLRTYLLGRTGAQSLPISPAGHLGHNSARQSQIPP